jgi:hypothetical protein
MPSARKTIIYIGIIMGILILLQQYTDHSYYKANHNHLKIGSITAWEQLSFNDKPMLSDAVNNYLQNLELKIEKLNLTNALIVYDSQYNHQLTEDVESLKNLHLKLKNKSHLFSQIEK